MIVEMEGEDIRKGAKDATGREKRAEYNAAYGNERKPGRDVCATYSAVIRSPAAALHSVYPRQIPLDTILSLLYTLSCRHPPGC